MPPALTWKMGIEIELMAPPGGSREALARTVAARVGGSVERFFHPQSEPSKVPGTPTFENLTPGFRVRGADGAPHASFVDDITLQHGLDKQRAASPGWYRIVSDDARLLQLVITQCDPLAPLTQVLEPLAALFCTSVERHPSGMVKVTDGRNASVALAASLPGERERRCEIVTAPLQTRQCETLALLLEEARSAGFTLPKEGATHIHFDAERLKSARAISRCQDQGVAQNGGGGRSLSCKNQRRMRSANGGLNTTVTFVNRTQETRAVLWFDFAGQPKDYGMLEPGQSKAIQTWTTHPWMFTDGPGNCIEMYMPAAGSPTFSITRPSPGFGAE